MSETLTQDGDKFFGLDCSPITLQRDGQIYTYLLDNITFSNPSNEVTDNDDAGAMDDQVIIRQPKEGSAVLQIKKGTPIPEPGETFVLADTTRNPGQYLIRTSDEPQAAGAYLKSNITFRKVLNPAEPAAPTIYFPGGAENKTFATYEDYQAAQTDGTLGAYAKDYKGVNLPVSVVTGSTSGALENWEDQTQAWFTEFVYKATDADGRTTTATRRVTISPQA